MNVYKVGRKYPKRISIIALNQETVESRAEELHEGQNSVVTIEDSNETIISIQRSANEKWEQLNQPPARKLIPRTSSFSC